jgi:uncharacterized protein with HEPN domain
MSKRPIPVLIEDMWEAIERIEQYTRGMVSAVFGEDRRTSDAVVRNLEIIGEAANRLPDDFTQHHPEIEWEQIVGLRHRIVHEYFGIDLEIVWQILQRDLPALKSRLQRLHSPS